MRNGIIVLGFFIIVLILTAGCTSAQSGDTNVKTTPTYDSIGYHSLDPLQFQKFFPNIPGWQMDKPFIITAKSSSPNIMAGYGNSENHHVVHVLFRDLGPYSNSYLNSNTQNRIINFHGYPAVKVSGDIDIADDRGMGVYIKINSRLAVEINADGLISENYSLSDADADIETFANAIDFNGFAALV